MVSFGSESYEWETGEENPIGIYLDADTEIDSFIYIVTYDPDILEYERGGTVLADGQIEVRVNDVDDTSDVRYLYFTPLTSETTSISVTDVTVTGSDGEEYTAEDISVNVNGVPESSGLLEGISVNGTAIPGFAADKTEYTVYVQSDVTEAEITWTPSDVDVEVSDTALAEGNNVILLTCTDEAGNRAEYTVNVYRPAAQAEETGISEPDEDAQFPFLQIIEQKGISLAVLIVLAVLVLFFVILCLLKLYMVREQRRRAERRQQRLERRRRLEEESDEEQTEESRAAAAGDKEQPAGDTAAGKKNAKAESSPDGGSGTGDYDTADGQGMDTDWDDGEEDSGAEIEIRVSHVTMNFKWEKDESSSIKEMVIRTLKRQRSFEYFCALDDISFDVRKGEVVGIIGTNGSGKSTILKIISGAMVPTKGKVTVDKRKIQLLTLGTGFDMELTGRENVYLNGAIIGYTREYIDQKYEDIVKFAELEGFMEERVKNYSSGMVSRLGFAIATARDTPEILILDEVLSVGDMFFRKKSEARIQEMIHGGSTVLIVSHSTSVIRKNCTKVVWIEKSKLRMIGKPDEVCKAYEKMSS